MCGILASISVERFPRRNGLGHARLSINDLSIDADQPIHSDDGTIHAVVNGEVYDFDRLRQVLTEQHGYHFKSHSDSEVLVALYKVYGAPDFIEHVRGEFAFILYDERRDLVIAGRDRFGIKPLHWTFVRDESGEKRLLVASEAKAFLPLGWQPEWDVGAIVDGGYLNGERTVFKDVHKVLPGCWLEMHSDGTIHHHRYWDMDYNEKDKVETRQLDDIISGVRERLTEAVRLRLRADVPVGIYLSGGIDSSAVAGIVAHLVREDGVLAGTEDASKHIRCFTIQFPSGSGFDESDIADRTAEWLGVDLAKKDMNEGTLAEYFTDSIFHTELPCHDLAGVGKYGLSMEARDNGFKVVLSGEGSDEIFAGYPFFMGDVLTEPDLSMPTSPLAKDQKTRLDLLRMSNDVLEKVIKWSGLWLHRPDQDSSADDVQGVAPTLYFQPSLATWAPWVSRRWPDMNCRATVAASHDPKVRAKMANRWHSLHTAEYVWTKSVLPNFILSTLGDRAEMAHSIEARTPFLDHHLVEYVNRLPPSLKYAYTPETEDFGEQGPYWTDGTAPQKLLTEKWILREAAKPFITEELYKRKKHPYSAPFKWPKEGPIHQMLQKLLTREAVDNLGFLTYEVVEQGFNKGFGEEADARAFRNLLVYASLVTIGQRFDVKKAESRDWAPVTGRV
ncbi:asparagine synthase [Trichoderma guizhouense]|uniref:Asparagine synthase n=1 Tax=Trichoderma guizhouense TaxID=1491466 RepID=A0A1T3CX23_9HYPO|nr:asparagine synthase [Trichoderma guizhouense]